MAENSSVPRVVKFAFDEFSVRTLWEMDRTMQTV